MVIVLAPSSFAILRSEFALNATRHSSAYRLTLSLSLLARATVDGGGVLLKFDDNDVLAFAGLPLRSKPLAPPATGQYPRPRPSVAKISTSLAESNHDSAIREAHHQRESYS